MLCRTLSADITIKVVLKSFCGRRETRVSMVSQRHSRLMPLIASMSLMASIDELHLPWLSSPVIERA